MTYQPAISVIVPVIPGGDVSITLNSVAKMRYPLDKVEIMVVEGRNPSYQRNEAARQAQGEILYFLDDDVNADERLFRYVVEVFEDESVSVVGGPALTPESDSVKQKCFGAVLASVFGAYIARERWYPMGLIRDATESELILCNMAFRKSAFVEEKGFNVDLFPNEENELLNRFRLRNRRLVYHPLAVVYRSQPKDFRSFFKKIFNYGRGRFEHLYLMPEFVKPVFAVPSVFLFYVLSLPFFFRNPYYLLPLGVYGLLVGFATLSIVLGMRQFSLAYYLPLSFFCLHLSYGLGFLWGAIRKLFGIKQERDLNIRITKIKGFGETRMSVREAC
jgi:cellulose synthase/poly-beta-1,6-N-acetylglucosamine synthase-like glycosyltransferase